MPDSMDDVGGRDNETLTDVVAAAAAEVGADMPMLVPAIANPFPMVLIVAQDEDDGTGCAAGVAGSP